MHLLNSNKIDLLGVSETWLTPSITDPFVSIPGYSLIRNDSPDLTRKHGVALYISMSFKFVRINCDIPNVLIVFLCVFEIYVIIVYRPPSNSLAENYALSNFIDGFCFEKEVMILGDFNLQELP